jgi:hypothetical protein
VIGRFFKDAGRPANAYFCDDLREDLVRHEILVTQFILDTRPDRWVRLWDVDKKFHADAELWFGQTKVYIELDTGQTPYRRVWRKFKRYGELIGAKEFVVWVCLAEYRLHGLKRRGTLLKGKGVFSVLGSKRFVDTSGDEVILNR